MMKTMKRVMKALSGMGIAVGLVVLAAFASPAANAATAEIRVGGDVSACNGFFAVVRDAVRDDAGINLVITPSSSSQALLDLDSGIIDIAATDLALENIVTDLEKKGYLIVSENFQAQGIGTNSILVYLNKANKVPALSQEQLRGIFTGKITNWKQVGGANQKIVVVWSNETPEQNQLFSRYVIGNRPIVKTAVKATDPQEIIERIVNTPGGIGIASHAYKSARTHNPKTPFVSSKVIAITKGAPTDHSRNVLETVKSYDF